MFLIAVGTPFGGMILVGDDDGYLFASSDEAIEYGKGRFDYVPWEIVEIISGTRAAEIFPEEEEKKEVPDPEEN